MTVSSTALRADAVGNGSTATFPFTFPVQSASELTVVTRDTSGVETMLVYTTDYTVTLATSGEGGDVVLTAGNLTNGYAIAILPNEPTTQETSVRNQGAYFPDQAESDLDRGTIRDKQLQEQADRSLHLPRSEAGTAAKATLPFDRASMFLAFDSSKNPIASPGPSEVPISAPMVPVVQAASLAVARAAMGPWSDALATATGALTARDLQSRFADALWTKDFGAVADGTTDDTAAIQAAFDSGKPIRFSPGSYKISATGININTAGQWVDFAGATFTTMAGPLRIQASHVVAKDFRASISNALTGGVIIVGNPTDSTKTSHEWTLINPWISATTAKYGVVVANGSFIGDIYAPHITNGGGAVTSGSRGLFIGEQVQSVTVWGGAIVGWETQFEIRGSDRIAFHNTDLGDGSANGYYGLVNAIPAAASATPFGTGVYPNGEGSWWGSATQQVYNLSLTGCYCELANIAIYCKTGLAVKGLNLVGNLIAVNNSSPNVTVGTRIVKSDIPLYGLNLVGNTCELVDYIVEANAAVQTPNISGNTFTDLGRGTSHVGVWATGSQATAFPALTTDPEALLEMVGMRPTGGPRISRRRVIVTAVDLNSLNTDVATITGLPAKYRPAACVVYDASVSMSTGQFAIRDAAAGAGNVVVATGSLAAATTAAVVTNAGSVTTAQYFIAPTLYIRCTTAQGSAATITVHFEFEDLT